MIATDWNKVKEIVYSALSQPVADRARYVDELCGHDTALSSEVKLLLDSYDSGFLEQSLLVEVAIATGETKNLLENGFAFDHYEILKLLGRGGMGEVYLADDKKLNRLIAIKIIHDDSGLRNDAEERLIREARAAAKLNDPHICPVYEIGRIGERPYVAMQYVVGTRLDEYISQGRLTIEEAISYARQIASALVTSHANGLIHRDIKPANIIIDLQKRVKVLDFGLAKDTAPGSGTPDLTGNGLIAGTVGYMSPEHLRDKTVDGRTDVWSLGVVIYQMVTGRLPFVGENKADLISNILNSDFIALPKGSRTLASLNHVLRRALEKDPDARYATAEDLYSDLTELEKTGLLNQPAIAITTPGRSFRSKAVVVAIILFVSLGLGGFYFLNQLNQQELKAHAFIDGSAGGRTTKTIFNVKRATAGAISHLSFSPDAEHLVCAISDGGRSSIYQLSVNGAPALRLTPGGATDRSPVWSPNGERIAFLSDREGRSAIWTVPKGGGEATLLTDLGAPDQFLELRKWSNDGARIFIDSEDGPQIVDIQSGAMTPLDLSGVSGTPIRGFSISRDERQLLVPTGNAGTRSNWTKAVGSSTATLMSQDVTQKGLLDWFADNSGFAYTEHDGRRFQVFVRDSTSSMKQQITNSDFNASSPAVSPKNDQIAFVSNIDQANVYRVDVKTGKHDIVTRNINMQLFPSVSPNGKHRVYQVISESAEMTSGQLIINQLSTDHANPNGEPVMKQFGCCTKWSPDSREISYIRQVGSELNIYKVSLDNQVETQLTKGGIVTAPLSIAPAGFHYPSYDWSRDGSRIVFVSRNGGMERLSAINNDGSDLQHLAEFDRKVTSVVSPVWSPDSAKIAFINRDKTASKSRTSGTQLRVHSISGLETIAEFKNPATVLAWGSDGESLFVAEQKLDGYAVMRIDVKSGQAMRPVTTLTGAESGGIRISPDRSWVSYSATRGGINNLCVSGIGKEDVRCLTSNDDPTIFYSSGEWTPDSSSVLYSKQTGGMQVSITSLSQ